MSDVMHFLSEVMRDADKKQAFVADPGAAMSAAGLNEDQQAAINSRDPQQVADHIGQELGSTGPHAW